MTAAQGVLLLVVSLAVYLAVGHRLAVPAGVRAFKAARARWDLLARTDPEFGRTEARMAYTSWMLWWPILVWVAPVRWLAQKVTGGRGLDARLREEQARERVERNAHQGSEW